MSKCCAQCECHCLKLNSKQMMRWRLSLSLSLSHTQAYTHTLRKHSHRNGDNRRNKGAFYVVCVLFRGAFYTHTHDILWYLNRRGRYIDSFDIKRFWYRKIWTRHTYALEFIYTDLNSMGTKSRQLWCCWRCGEWVTYNGLDIYIAIIFLLEEDAHSSLHCKRATTAIVSLRPSVSLSIDRSQSATPASAIPPQCQPPTYLASLRPLASAIRPGAQYTPWTRNEQSIEWL